MILRGSAKAGLPFFIAIFCGGPILFFIFFLYSLKKDYYFAGLLERAIFPRQISKSILYREREERERKTL